MTRPNEVCKSYTIHADGGSVTLSETPDRLAIEITVSRPNDTLLADRRSVRLSRTEFKAVCDLDSSYDGLQVQDPPEPEEPEELEEADHDVVPA